MSDFWTKALSAPAQPAAVQTTDRPWWDRPVLPPVGEAPPTSVVHDPRPSPAHLPSKAISARSTETCPECGSGNYFKTGASTMTQCYECGYNPRFGAQSGAVGLPSSDSGPATPARQVAAAHTGYSGTVVAHIN